MMTWALLLPLLLACPQGQVECDSGAPAEPADSGAYTLCPHEDGADCDGDGYTVPEDCYDHDADIHPFAADSGYRFSPDPGWVDSDCNGVDGPFALVAGGGYHFQDVPDMNGDGVRDFVSTYYNYYKATYRGVYVQLSSDLHDPADSWDDLISKTMISYEYMGEFHLWGYFSTGSSLGDIDKDGVRDFGVLCGYSGPSPSTPGFCIFEGSPNDGVFGAEPWKVVPDTSVWEVPVRVLGDLDGDGGDDVVIGNAPAYIYGTTDIGRPEFAWNDWRISLPLEYSNDGTPSEDELRLNFGLERADVDGDGMEELFTGTRFFEGADLSLPGAYDGSDGWDSQRLGGPGADCPLRPAGDVNGDGRSDLLLHCTTQDEDGWLEVSSFIPGQVAQTSLIAAVRGTPEFPVGVVAGSVGDADDDGWGDLGVGGRSADGSLLGTSDGITILRGAELTGTVELDSSMRLIAAAHVGDIGLTDFDGDDQQDLMVNSYLVGLLAHADILP